MHFMITLPKTYWFWDESLVRATKFNCLCLNMTALSYLPKLHSWLEHFSTAPPLLGHPPSTNLLFLPNLAFIIQHLYLTPVRLFRNTINSISTCILYVYLGSRFAFKTYFQIKQWTISHTSVNSELYHTLSVKVMDWSFKRENEIRTQAPLLQPSYFKGIKATMGISHWPLYRYHVIL